MKLLQQGLCVFEGETGSWRYYSNHNIEECLNDNVFHKLRMGIFGYPEKILF